MKIKINFSGFWPAFDPEANFFTDLLRKKYDVEISASPEYLFYSVFNYSYTDFDGVRIFFTGEDLTPNFNECDYAMGFEFLDFQDRYLRLPLYRLYTDHYSKINLPGRYNLEDFENRKFCNFIYSNPVPERDDFFKQLSEYKPVESGGRHLNNIGNPIRDKSQFQKGYRFSIAFENSSRPGYTSEKLLEAKINGTIPIYWGNPLVAQEFDDRSFINCHQYSNFMEVISRIDELENDPDQYLAMLNKPLTDRIISDESILDFFDNIFQNHGKEYRRGDNVYKRKEAKGYQMIYRKEISLLKKLRKKFKK